MTSAHGHGGKPQLAVTNGHLRHASGVQKWLLWKTMFPPVDQQIGHLCSEACKHPPLPPPGGERIAASGFLPYPLTLFWSDVCLSLSSLRCKLLRSRASMSLILEPQCASQCLGTFSKCWMHEQERSSKLGVNKLWSLGQVWPLVCFCK